MKKHCLFLLFCIMPACSIAKSLATIYNFAPLGRWLPIVTINTYTIILATSILSLAIALTCAHLNLRCILNETISIAPIDFVLLSIMAYCACRFVKLETSLPDIEIPCRELCAIYLKINPFSIVLHTILTIAETFYIFFLTHHNELYAEAPQ